MYNNFENFWVYLNLYSYYNDWTRGWYYNYTIQMQMYNKLYIDIFTLNTNVALFVYTESIIINRPILSHAYEYKECTRY